MTRRRRDNTSDNTSSSNTNNNNNINGSIFSDSFTNLDETQSNQINTDNNKDSTDIERLFKIGGEPKIKNISLGILIKNQVLYVSPSIEDAREHLISQLHEYSSI